jgi:hypothetical protein
VSADEEATGLVTPSNRPILRIVHLDVHGDLNDFVAELQRGRPILARCGIEAEVRSWQATYAGRDTGQVIVTLEFADLAAFARSEHAYAEAVGNPEFVAWATRLGDLRTITSDGLHIELGAARGRPVRPAG